MRVISLELKYLEDLNVCLLHGPILNPTARSRDAVVGCGRDCAGTMNLGVVGYAEFHSNFRLMKKSYEDEARSGFL